MSRLRIDDKPGVDTRHNVRDVLIFLSDAFEAMEQSADKSDGAMRGASKIIGLCVDALRETEQIEGGAHDGG